MLRLKLMKDLVILILDDDGGDHRSCLDPEILSLQQPADFDQS